MLAAASPAVSDSFPFVDGFRDAEVVILGEIHDNPTHHENQARIVSELQPSALVFEMIDAPTARKITPELRASEARLEAHLDWEASGWPDFTMYYPIFTAAPEAVIFGGALPRDDVRRAVTDGAAAVFGDAAPLFGLDQPLPEDQLQQRLTLQQEAHCNALPEDMLPGMVEAQRLRDAALAKATVAALEHARALGTGGPVVVITGNGHARDDWGVPAKLRTYYSNEIVIETLGQYEDTSPEIVPFSQTLSAAAAEREDPCAAFAK
jgi:uncharacterized iron-regulated protein